MNQWGLKPAMYRPCFPTHRNIKKIRKKVKKVLDRPLTIVHNEYVERVNIKGYV